VEKYLTGESEPSELIYFKVYKIQMPVIEQAPPRACALILLRRSVQAGTTWREAHESARKCALSVKPRHVLVRDVSVSAIV
jgi:hypothetical protein